MRGHPFRIKMLSSCLCDPISGDNIPSSFHSYSDFEPTRDLHPRDFSGKPLSVGEELLVDLHTFKRTKRGKLTSHDNSEPF